MKLLGRAGGSCQQPVPAKVGVQHQQRCREIAEGAVEVAASRLTYRAASVDRWRTAPVVEPPRRHLYAGVREVAWRTGIGDLIRTSHHPQAVMDEQGGRQPYTGTLKLMAPLAGRSESRGGVQLAVNGQIIADIALAHGRKASRRGRQRIRASPGSMGSNFMPVEPGRVGIAVAAVQMA